jgi:hypothetical protein
MAKMVEPVEARRQARVGLLELQELGQQIKAIAAAWVIRLASFMVLAAAAVLVL